MSVVRGWCPTAHRPMMSGDGLLVRVRPPMARLLAAQVTALCDLAEQYGSGLLEFTSRGNIQIRGVGERDHASLLDGLIKADLAPTDPRTDLPLTVSPFLAADEEASALVDALMRRAQDLPDLPGKIGIVIDIGRTRHLSAVSGDFRFERSVDGLILRADGAALGRPISIETAGQALVEMAEWFCATGGAASRRMRRHIGTSNLPAEWTVAKPVANTTVLPGPDVSKGVLGIEFGQIASRDLRSLMHETAAASVAISPWRTLHLLGGEHGLGRDEGACRTWGLSVEQTDISAKITDISRQSDISERYSDISHGGADVSPDPPDISQRAPDQVGLAVGSKGAVGQSLRQNGTGQAFITDISDPRRRFEACPGAPLCGQASVATRPLARQLAERLAVGEKAPAEVATLIARAMPDGDDAKRTPTFHPLARIHISGCDKGCAHRGTAAVTLVGRKGAFDLVLNGTASDTPLRWGLSEAEVLELLDDL